MMGVESGLAETGGHTLCPYPTDEGGWGQKTPTPHTWAILSPLGVNFRGKHSDLMRAGPGQAHDVRGQIAGGGQPHMAASGKFQGGCAGPCSVCVFCRLLGLWACFSLLESQPSPPLTAPSSPDVSHMRQREREGAASTADRALFLVLASFSPPYGKVGRRPEEAGGQAWSCLQTGRLACSSDGPGGDQPGAQHWEGLLPGLVEDHGHHFPDRGGTAPSTSGDAYCQASVNTHPPRAS